MKSSGSENQLLLGTRNPAAELPLSIEGAEIARPTSDAQKPEPKLFNRDDHCGMSDFIGRRRWVIAEGYIPPQSHGPAPEFTSHEAFCVLNASCRDAHIEVTIFYADREPVGPYRLIVPARRTRHFRFNNLDDPAPIPLGTSYSSLIESDVAIVVQHTRLDSRQSKNALLSTIAFPCSDQQQL